MAEETKKTRSKKTNEEPAINPSEAASSIPEDIEALEVSQEATKEDIASYDRVYKTGLRIVERASKKSRQEMYASEDVFNPDNESVNDDSSEMHREYVTLMMATKAQPARYLKGYVTGLTETENGIPLFKVKAHILKGFYQIFIPVEHMIVFPKNTPDNELKQAYKNLIGAEIKFCPMYVSEKEMVCYASRLRAQELESYYYYKRKRAGRDCPDVFEGKLVNGRIICIKERSIIVDLHGCDVEISNKDLSFRTFAVVSEEFQQNQPIILRIEEVTAYKFEPKGSEKEYNLIKCKASYKNAIKDPNELYWRQYHLGDILSAKVRWVNEKGISLLIDDKVEALSGIPNFIENIVRGDKLHVVIVEMDEKTHFIRCNITS